jgi:hypothetical protein
VADPLWFEVAKTLVTAGVTGTVGYLAVKVSASQRDIAERQANNTLMQRKVAEDKLNFDLFEQRYSIFEKLWEFLSEATRTDGALTSHGQVSNLIPKAQFLFGKTIASYIRDAHTKRIDLDAAYRRLKVNADAHGQDQKLIQDLENWFAQEAMECFKRFAPYLDFSSRKADSLDYFFNPERP